MKILFYVEMHPIRESFTQHSWILSEILKMVKYDHTNFKILANHRLTSMFKNDTNSDLFLTLNKHEKNKLESYFKPIWNEASISEWVSLMRGSNQRYALFYRSVLNRVRSSYPFDILVYWGTNDTIKLYCDSLGIPSVSMELGCSRKPYFVQTAYMDICGVNGASSINALDFKTISKIPMSFNKEACLDNDNNLNTPISDKKIRELMLSNWGRNVLLPLQLDDDSNILLYSEHKSVLDYVRDVTSKFTKKGYVCYIRPHPGMNARKYNKHKHLEIKKYVSNIKNVYWVETVASISMIEKSNIIVTQNSSLAFEASILDKIVVNLGKSCWNIPDVFPTIEDILEKRFDIKEYKKKLNTVISFILEYYLVPYDKVFTLSFFKKRLQELANNYKDNKNGIDLAQILTEKPINKLNSFFNEQCDSSSLSSPFEFYSQEKGNTVLGEIFGNKKIKQDFRCSNNNLERIAIKIATYMRTNSGTLRITLHEKNIDNPVYQEDFDMSELGDNSWLYFSFEKIQNSKNKDYSLRIQGVNSRIGSAVSCYLSYAHNFGNLYLNNVHFKGSLNMKLFAN